MNDEFYIGWEKKADARIGRRIRRISLASMVLASLAGIGLALSQHLIGTSVFEWGNLKTVLGILQAQPYPRLLVPRPGEPGDSATYSTYYLVAPWKFGLDKNKIAPLNGKRVAIKGTLIYRDNQTMIETKPEWIVASNEPTGNAPPPLVALGRRTLVGEIVDSKCFLGVMNPGQLAPHRACAIRCISGGAPPLLLVRQKTGPPLYLLLVSSAGTAVNSQVLDMVAQPVAITGDVEKQGDLWVLRADPRTYVRVN